MAEKKTFSLAEAMRDTIDSASTANMSSGDHFVDVDNMGDDEITNRILQLKIDAGNAILEIGRWLTVMKERKAHGEWAAWLAEQVDFSERIAQQYMQLYQGFSSNPNALSDLGKTKALKLLSLPPAERDEFLEAHDVPNMSTRELQQAIRERDEAREALDTALSDVKKAEEFAAALSHERDEARKVMDDALQDAKKAEERIKELESRPIDVAVQVDEEAVKRAADDARAAAEAEWSAKVKAAEDKLAKAQEKAKKAEDKAKSAGEKSSGEAEKYKAEAEHLRAELEAAKREQTKAAISGDADLALVGELGGQIAGAANKLHGILIKARGREDIQTAEAVQKAMLSLAEQIRGCAK